MKLVKKKNCTLVLDSRTLLRENDSGKHATRNTGSQKEKEKKTLFTCFLIIASVFVATGSSFESQKLTQACGWNEVCL